MKPEAFLKAYFQDMIDKGFVATELPLVLDIIDQAFNGNFELNQHAKDLYYRYVKICKD